MAWNRSTERELGIENREQNAGKLPLRGLIAAMIVVLGAGIAMWFFWADARPPMSNSTPIPASLIKEVKPAEVKSSPPPPVAKPISADEARKLSEKDANGFPQIVVADDGTKWYRGAIVPVEKAGAARRNGKPWGHREYFVASADNILTKMFVNGLVTGPSSAPSVDNDKYYEYLERSLKTEAVIAGEESDDAKDIANQLREVKELLREKIAAGETMKEIMKEAKSDQEKVAAARKNYSDMYREMLKNGASPQDLDELVNAANSILKDHFAAPIRHVPAVAAKLRRMKENGKGEGK